MSNRDRFALTREQLLEDYAKISVKRKNAAVAQVIRHGARQYLDILATQALGTPVCWDTLRNQMFGQSPAEIPRVKDWYALSDIGTALLLAPENEDDARLGFQVIELAVSQVPANLKTRRQRMLLVQSEILSGNRDGASQLIEAWADLAREEYGYLRGDLVNPFHGQEFPFGVSDGAWLDSFNSSFEKRGLSTIAIEAGEGFPIDRIVIKGTTEQVESRDTPEQPKVSVVITTYQPVFSELASSVKSITQQTYDNLEILVVDDASGDEFDSIFEQIALMDRRVRVIRLQTNGGTYIARNIGFAAADGVYYTGQDDDDWSHPERIAKQVERLEKEPGTPACRVMALTCTPDLMRVRLGYKPIASNASSLMVRAYWFDQLGGFLPIRKAADTEFLERLEAYTGSSVAQIDLPLSIVRILPDSLSRSDFRPSWSHPARRQFKSSYKYWHSSASREHLRIAEDANQVSVPTRFEVQRSGVETLDVVFAGDWRQYGGPQKSMLEEISALTAAGYRVGVLHMEAPRFMKTRIEPLNSAIQELINKKVVTEVLYDDQVRVRLLILRYPPILQFAPDTPSELAVDKMIILANQAPSERDGSDIRYLVGDCEDNARRIFRTDTIWVPQGPQVREAIEPYCGESLAQFDMPGILNPDDWFRPSSRVASRVLPVLGRHSRDNRMKWPEDIKTIRNVYPFDGSVDVRILGGAEKALEVLKRDSVPAGWTVFATNAIEPKKFLHSLDFYAFFQNSSATEAFGRSVLEAIASGVVVILPPHFRPVFGDAAIYVDAEEVIPTVRRFFSDKQLYDRQVLKARSLVESSFSHNAYRQLIDGILAQQDASQAMQT